MVVLDPLVVVSLSCVRFEGKVLTNLQAEEYSMLGQDLCSTWEEVLVSEYINLEERDLAQDRGIQTSQKMPPLVSVQRLWDSCPF